MLHATDDQVAPTCLSNGDIESVPQDGWPVVTLILSIYSTCSSTAWLVIACLQPMWHFVSSSGSLTPANATFITALVAKTIEISFTTVFITFLGQVLSRRALSRREKGVTLAELTMRDFVLQPGTLFTRGSSVNYTTRTLLGLLTVLAAINTTLYTTASDAMVSPKLSFSAWSQRTLDGNIQATYGDINYIRERFYQMKCLYPFESLMSINGLRSLCLQEYFSEDSTNNLMEFMAAWDNVNTNGTSLAQDVKSRPRGTMKLFPNTIMVSAWIDTDKSNIKENWKKHQRIVDDVTLAMPHPGVYFAATHPTNGIPQPKDLDGVGGYNIRASVISPAVNVKCVDMTKDELAPLVYTEWPNALNNDTGIGSQKIGYPGWRKDVPSKFYNRTVVDDIFQWDQKYGRRPPVFRLFPADYNFVTNSSPAVWEMSSMYIMGKHPKTSNYTLCDLHSRLTPDCSTRFDMSGTEGGRLAVHCQEENDESSYRRRNKVNETDLASWGPQPAWRVLAGEMIWPDLGSGERNSNASKALLLTHLIVLPNWDGERIMPSLAEALAVLVSSTLVAASMDTRFGPTWDYDEVTLSTAAIESFKATVRTQGYKSTHANQWQGLLYVVLAMVVLINLLCLGFFIVSWRLRLTTDYTESVNLFTLALMSPPSHQLRGYCGSGPWGRAFSVPWRVVGVTERGTTPSANDEVDELCRPESSDEEGGGGGPSVDYQDGIPLEPRRGMVQEGMENYSHPKTPNAGGVGRRNGYEPIHFYLRHAGNPVKGKWKATERCESPNLSPPRSGGSYQRLSNKKTWL
ncbi:hypothetical protein MAPG_07912 [Magnaporthiopsis poae ATCC 64411]|uniref:Mcm2 3 5 family protein n=1 Tax=Magnaporthiopsis poae (strain ATCC 64411 / 73-15) TaxID=644358 RepID=A0A0C4E5Y3_MAGP6|nr:hypothetical protein MAPG_07912 [Magnaporthiopsis poae ATCC 64411]